MTRYTATVTVELPSSMDEGPLLVLASTVLEALANNDVTVVYLAVEPGDPR